MSQIDPQNSDLTITPFPREREIVVDAGRLGRRRPMFHGLVELDVTVPRQKIQAHLDSTGEKLSFTGYLVACLGRAVAANPAVQSTRDWRGRLVTFRDVDVVTLIETKVDRVALPHIIRQAHTKTFLEISREIRAVQERPRSSAQTSNPLMRLGPYAPRWLRNIFYWGLRKNPRWLKENSGTVVLSSVGMFGQGRSGWGIAFTPWHSLAVTAGGMAEKPGVVAGRIEPRQMLSLTLSFDHDVVDGAPAARFARAFADWVEGAELLAGLP